MVFQSSVASFVEGISHWGMCFEASGGPGGIRREQKGGKSFCEVHPSEGGEPGKDGRLKTEKDHF